MKKWILKVYILDKTKAELKEKLMKNPSALNLWNPGCTEYDCYHHLVAGKNATLLVRFHLKGKDYKNINLPFWKRWDQKTKPEKEQNHNKRQLY